MQQLFCLVFLHKIILSPLLDQILQIVSVLFHLHQQALQDQAHGVAADMQKSISFCRKYLGHTHSISLLLASALRNQGVPMVHWNNIFVPG
jgi:hypothetical protein